MDGVRQGTAPARERRLPGNGVRQGTAPARERRPPGNGACQGTAPARERRPPGNDRRGGVFRPAGARAPLRRVWAARRAGLRFGRLPHGQGHRGNRHQVDRSDLMRTPRDLSRWSAAAHFVDCRGASPEGGTRADRRGAPDAGLSARLTPRSRVKMPLGADGRAVRGRRTIRVAGDERHEPTHRGKARPSRHSTCATQPAGEAWANTTVSKKAHPRGWRSGAKHSTS